MENRRNIIATEEQDLRSGSTGWHFGELRTLNIYDLVFFRFFFTPVIIDHKFASESARPILMRDLEMFSVSP